MLWAASQLLPCVKTSFVFVFACMPAILYMHTACDLEVGCRLCDPRNLGPLSPILITI